MILVLMMIKVKQGAQLSSLINRLHSGSVWGFKPWPAPRQLHLNFTHNHTYNIWMSEPDLLPNPNQELFTITVQQVFWKAAQNFQCFESVSVEDIDSLQLPSRWIRIPSQPHRKKLSSSSDPVVLIWGLSLCLASALSQGLPRYTADRQGCQESLLNLFLRTQKNLQCDRRQWWELPLWDFSGIIIILQ